MDGSYSVVFKVKYGDVLRRFNAKVVNGELVLGMDGLRDKIDSLFGFTPDVELMLTYIDEDDDVVSLVDADDLRDVVRQRLDPLRITVKLKSEKDEKTSNDSSGSSATQSRSSGVKQPVQNLNDAVAEVTKKLPEPMREALKVLTSDVTSKASAAAPVATEVIDAFAKLGFSFMGQPSGSLQHGSSSSGTVDTDSGKSNLNADADKVSSNGKEVKSFEKGEDVCKVQPETAKEIEKPKRGREPADTSSEKASGSTAGAHVPAPDGRKISVCKKEKMKKDKLKNMFAQRNMIIRKLAGQYPPLIPFSENYCANEFGANSKKPTETQPVTGSANIWKYNPFTEGYLGVGRVRSVAPGGLYGAPGSIWSNVSGSGFRPMPECPFSGVSIGSSSTSPPLSSPVIQSKGTYSQNDGSGLSFHRGVRCDGCGVHPIIGPRFKSKVRMDYDLCRICFSQIGNETDYIRMDLPAVFRHHTPFKAMSDSVSCKNSKSKSSASKLDSRFIVDVNIFDGTMMAPSTSFTKIWRMRNSGSAVWPQGTFLLWIGGDKLTDQPSVEVAVPAGGLLVDQELDIAVDFRAPELPGRYVSYWRLVSPSGQKFGQRVWVLIQVDASFKGIEPETAHGLNLNLPPVFSGTCVAETASVEVEPIVESSHIEPDDNLKKMVESVEPLVYSQPENDQEMKFPVNDSLLVNNSASSSVHMSEPSLLDTTIASAPVVENKIDTGSSDYVASVEMSVPNPVALVLEPQVKDSEAPAEYVSSTDISVPDPIVRIVDPEFPPAPISDPQASAPELEEKTEMEARLLKELEEMGFKRVDLNKEVLRMSDYDLEQAVDELCGVSEWDPMLEELQEMGFHDTKTNKELLKKNGGSIKRVVMDLIAGEEDN